NPFGGEDRFWMGPEGGQFSIFFSKDVPFELEHWFTPAALDTEPFDLIAKTRDHVRFGRSLQLTNYSGTKFNVRVDREVRLLSALSRRGGWRSKILSSSSAGTDNIGARLASTQSVAGPFSAVTTLPTKRSRLSSSAFAQARPITSTPRGSCRTILTRAMSPTA